MRDPLNKDEMEQYLENQVNQHRLYPSDHIWRNIQEQLHEKVRWPALPFILLSIIAALVVGTLLVKPEEHFVYRSHLLATDAPAPVHKDNSAIQPLEESLATSVITQKTIAYATERLKLYKTDDSIITAKDSVATSPALSVVTLMARPTAVILPPAAPVVTLTKPASVAIPTGYYIDSLISAVNALAGKPEAPISEQVQDKSVQETMAAPAIKLPANQGRWSFHMYVTPSTTYRRLVSGKNIKTHSDLQGNTPLAPVYTDDVNNVVKHSPGSGFEVGFGFGYQLNKQFTLKAGLQYNNRKYSIEASSAHSSETANVVLQGQDTLRFYTPYRNLKGSYPITLQNSYQELAIPISILWKGWQHNKLSWHVGASIQPTLGLSKEVFIVSTDYKNYLNGASLMRSWNINTSFETFLSYQAGNIQWHIGPQFRYQQFSSFKKEYPVKEFLLDYGIKIGFSTTIK